MVNGDEAVLFNLQSRKSLYSVLIKVHEFGVLYGTLVW